MRWIIYLALIAVTLLVPVNRTDVAKLQPVEVICLQRRGEDLQIRTDTEDSGAGKNLKAAIEDLEKSTPGIIYLDTAEYLLIYLGCEMEADQIKEYLKDNVRICEISQQMNLADAAVYLDIHRPQQTMRIWKPGETEVKLRIEDGRFQLVENNKKKGEKGVDKTALS